MDDRTRYETVKSRLRAIEEGTALQVLDALEPTPYSLHEVQSTLDEMVLAERDEFQKAGKVYRWKKTLSVSYGQRLTLAQSLLQQLEDRAEHVLDTLHQLH